MPPGCWVWPLVLAYSSSVCAALISMGAGFAIIPSLSIQSAAEGLRDTPELLFTLAIDPIMSVMSALVFSVLVGLAATWAKADTITNVLEEFQRIVLDIVTRVIIPFCLLHCRYFCRPGLSGSITKQLPVFLIVILIVMVGHYIWLAVLYGLAGAYSGENPWEVLRYYGPAYLTAVGTMSSALLWRWRCGAPRSPRCCARIWWISAYPCLPTFTCAARCSLRCSL